MEARRRWADLAAVKYCSARCRRRRNLPRIDRALEAAILELVQQRGSGKTICPSEAARQVGDEDSWRSLMPRTRDAARRLVAQGRLEVLQRGRVVDPSSAKGPIRLRLRH